MAEDTEDSAHAEESYPVPPPSPKSDGVGIQPLAVRSGDAALGKEGTTPSATEDLIHTLVENLDPAKAPYDLKLMQACEGVCLRPNGAAAPEERARVFPTGFVEPTTPPASRATRRERDLQSGLGHHEIELPLFLRAAELAPLLGLTEGGVRAMLRRGEIPASRLGRSWVVRRDALLEHFKRAEREQARSRAELDLAVDRAIRGVPSRRGPRTTRNATD